MKKTSPKTYAINPNVEFTYWNQSSWEFSIDHRNIDEETSNRYQAFAWMLTQEFAQRPIPAKHIDKFIEMCKEIFALTSEAA